MVSLRDKLLMRKCTNNNYKFKFLCIPTFSQLFAFLFGTGLLIKKLKKAYNHASDFITQLLFSPF